MKTLISIISVLVLTFTTVTAFSNARDSDGSRIQARSITLGSAVKDKVNPPSDKADWFYFRIKQTQKVKIELVTNSDSAQLSLSNTVGKSIYSGSTNKKVLNSTKTLKPGIYYVSVSSKTGVSYSLLIK